MNSVLAVISYGLSGHEALELFRQRWGIETFCSHLKKRGYQFEDTQMIKRVRIWHCAKSVFRQGFESPHRILKSPARCAADIAEFFERVLKLRLLEKFVVSRDVG